MTYEKIKKFLQKGKIAMLPNYKGYFKWNWGTNQMYFINGDYIKLESDLSKEKERDDWYYII